LITSFDDHSRYLLYARLNPKFAVPNHQDCGAKPLATKLVSRFAPQQIYEYAYVAKSLQLRVSLRALKACRFPEFNAILKFMLLSIASKH
jgi:hypothetical protein